jgi:hypothetical protein
LEPANALHFREPSLDFATQVIIDQASDLAWSLLNKAACQLVRESINVVGVSTAHEGLGVVDRRGTRPTA